MFNPGKKGHVALDYGAQAFVGVRFVARNLRKKLRHEPGMIELLFFFGAEIRFGTGQPQEIALEDYLLFAQCTAVRIDQSFLSKREKAVQTGIDETAGFSRLLIQKMR